MDRSKQALFGTDLFKYMKFFTYLLVLVTRVTLQIRTYESVRHVTFFLYEIRADNLPLMSSIWPTILISLAYLFIVLYAGPR